MNNVVPTSKDDIGELRREFDRLKSDLSDIRTNISDLGSDAVRTARAGMAQTRDRIGNTVDAAGAKGKESLEAVEQQVAAHPFMSLAAALALGMVVGFGLTRRG